MRHLEIWPEPGMFLLEAAVSLGCLSPSDYGDCPPTAGRSNLIFHLAILCSRGATLFGREPNVFPVSGQTLGSAESQRFLPPVCTERRKATENQPPGLTGATPGHQP